MRPRTFGILLLLSMFACAGVGAAQAQGASTKITLCHSGNGTSWTSITVAPQAVINGHDGHAHDIIPPFTYSTGQGSGSYPGKNWDAEGKSILANDCAKPEPPPHATPPTVTYAARVCPSYTDVYANRARNNLMESLQDLGPDSPYGPGAEVVPSVEDAGVQANCTPLTGWRFTLGTGIQTSPGDTGPWGKLSKVTGPFSTSIVTQPSVPLLNVNGEPTGSSIRGAVTVPLTPQQEDLAAQTSRLWVQSGQPGDPLLTGTFGAAYSFAAVRCAVDNLNGDNVEWIGMPEGHANVFCYVFLIQKPPASGTIIVTKKVEAADGTTSVTGTATFTGTVSYTPDGEFSLTATSGAPASATFVRDATTGGTAPWTIVERSTSGWRLRALECVSSGSSTSVTTITNAGGTAGSAAVTLAGGDTVRCTFTNRLTPPRSIIIAKTTRGGAGRFQYTVTPLDGSAPARTTAIRTTTPGVPVAAQPITFAVPGRYRIEEHLPSSSGGKWVLTKVVCNGVRQPLPGPGGGVEVTITKTRGAACGFVNTFAPKGRITLRKRTIDGTGTVGFVVTSATDEAFERSQSATTTVSGPAGTVRATGDPLKRIPLGTYVVQETGMAYTPEGYWTLDAVTCNGQSVLAVDGRVTIALTARHPSADCTFENRFVGTSGVLPPDPPGPGEVVPVADVAISLAVPGPSRGIAQGTRVNYSSVVRNLGPTAAYNVVARFSGPRAVLPATMRASRGGCSGTTIITCRLGTLLPGERVVITASRVVRTLGSFRLTAVVATSTTETTLLNNVDRVPIRVVAALGAAVPVTG